MPHSLLMPTTISSTLSSASSWMSRRHARSGRPKSLRSRTMIERPRHASVSNPDWLAADTAYGSAPNLEWLVNEKSIAPHIPVIDKAKREDGTFSRTDFSYDKERDTYTCPAGKTLKTSGRLVNGGATLLYTAKTYDCAPCPLKSSVLCEVATTQSATRRQRGSP